MTPVNEAVDKLRTVLSRATDGSLRAARDHHAAHVALANSGASEALLEDDGPEDNMLDDPSMQDVMDEWLWEQGDDE